MNKAFVVNMKSPYLPSSQNIYTNLNPQTIRYRVAGHHLLNLVLL
jgi:hypothetical protein